MRVLGAATLTGGLLWMSALTWASTFVPLVVVLVAASHCRVDSRAAIRASSALSIAVAANIGVLVLVPRLFGYDRYAGFSIAAQLENHHGFRGFVEPLAYAMTRAEGILELVLFASLPVAAALTLGRRGARLGSAESAPLLHAGSSAGTIAVCAASGC